MRMFTTQSNRDIHKVRRKGKKKNELKKYPISNYITIKK